MISYKRPQAIKSARAEIWQRIEEKGETLEQLIMDPPKKNDGSLTTKGNIETEYEQCKCWNRHNKKHKDQLGN